jgi:hypothetical protein
MENKMRNSPILTFIIVTLLFSSCQTFMNALVNEVTGTGIASSSPSAANQNTSSPTSSKSRTENVQSGMPLTKMVREEYEEPHTTKCILCSGSGKCYSCHGSGMAKSKKNKKDGVRCASCHGSGNCKKCGGKKYITTYKKKYRYVKKEIYSSSESSENDEDSRTSDKDSSSKTYRTCSWCDGSGRILKEGTQNGSSLQGKENGTCSECGEQLYKGKSHKHYNCDHCKGTGKLEN